MLMQNKKGLIMGVANDRSIAWGIAKAISKNGGKIAFTYQGEPLKKRVKPLAESINSNLIIPCDTFSLGPRGPSGVIPIHSLCFTNLKIFFKETFEFFDDLGIFLSLKKLPTIDPNLPSLCSEAIILIFELLDHENDIIIN